MKPEESLLEPCSHSRCRRKVFHVQIVRQRGAPERMVLDAEPSTWEAGARIKLTGHSGGWGLLARKLTAGQIHEAFAVRELYVPHTERCEVAQKRTKAKKTEGHA